MRRDASAGRHGAKNGARRGTIFQQEALNCSIFTGPASQKAPKVAPKKSVLKWFVSRSTPLGLTARRGESQYVACFDASLPAFQARPRAKIDPVSGPARMHFRCPCWAHRSWSELRKAPAPGPCSDRRRTGGSNTSAGTTTRRIRLGSKPRLA
jgi:hypothetical protein